MIHRFFLQAILLMVISVAYAQDTLYFRLSNPWNTVKAEDGKYLRKCIKEKDYCHVWDYNGRNILVTDSYYNDTSFSVKLFCHKYFDEEKGFLEQTRCYENGRLNGYWVEYNSKGDTTKWFLFENNFVKERWLSDPPTEQRGFIPRPVKAKFPGGEKAWLKYLKKSIYKPDSLLNIKGNVVVEFELAPSGLIQSARVITGLHPVLDQEALRVIRNSPQWIPGELNGQKVKVVTTQAIAFK